MRVPLTPLRFLYRARDQFGSKVGIVDTGQSWTYRDFSWRCHRLAALLASWRLPAGSRVALLSYNQHPLLEAYYGVPLAGCILLPLNTRLRAADFRHILNDAKAGFSSSIRTFFLSSRRSVATSIASGVSWLWSPDRPAPGSNRSPTGN